MLEYDGTGFSGWQRQPKRRTVQEEVEKAIEKITGEKARLTAAGRTDAGVHARKQVANFFSATRLSRETLQRALNALLPKDVRVTKVAQALLDFDARRRAKSRTYRYVLVQKPTALARFFTWYVFQPLNLTKMQSATRFLLGRHDFSSFCVREADEKSRRCTVAQARWRKAGAGIVFDITADRFLRGMVRSIVGTLVGVGRGKISAAQFRSILRRRDRRKAGPSAPAHGLCLWDVAY